MEGYQFTTAQNVTLNYAYASPGDRVVAYILDILILTGYFIAILFVVAGLDSLHLFNRDFMVLWIILGIIAALPALFYALLFEYFTQGQTPGKRALKIKVVSMNGERLSFGQCFIRWVFGLIDFGTCYGFTALLVISVTQRKQRIGDMLAGTLVISTNQFTPLTSTVYTETENTKQTRYLTVNRLTAREVEIIKEVLRHFDKEDKSNLVALTATRVRNAIGAGTEQDDLSFLRTVVEDYNISAKA